MWIRIDSQSGVPIYRQIVRQIEQAVMAGALQAGDRLPAVRELAIDLALNPGTVVKAYDELQHLGIIEQPRGRGTFVRAVPTLSAPERAERLRAAVEALMAEAEQLGFAPGDVLSMLQRITGTARDGHEEDGHAGR